jgi:mannose-6-phosphate isomerase-like protein (cupin superfamily)
MKESLLEIRDHTGDGYRPLVDFGAWRVALLRYADDMLPQNIHRFQRHDETDEVFVLMRGRCVLYIGEGDETITAIRTVDMEPTKVYNVKRGVWHNHTLSKDAVVLIVENCDTGDHNSPFCPLDEGQREQVIDLCAALWDGQSVSD